MFPFFHKCRNKTTKHMTEYTTQTTSIKFDKMEQSQGGQAVSVEERILFLAESPDCNHPRELRAIAFQVRKLEDRIKQLESENDALRADLLLWEEKEVKP
jgi:cell shape-determining protein MreC